MLREYEFTLITSAQITENDAGELLKKYEGIMTQEGGQLLRKNTWGTRRLAYPIKKHFRGQYTIYDLVGRPEHLAEAERLMRIDDHVLRYLSVRLGDEVTDIEGRKAEIAKAEADAAARESRKDR